MEGAMKLGPFLIVSAILHAVFGTAGLLVPEMMSGMFGIGLDAGGVTVARLLGATLLGVAVILWYSRNLVAAEILKGVLIGGFALNALSVVIALLAVTGGVMEPRAWIGIVIRLALAAGFGYFAFVKNTSPTK